VLYLVAYGAMEGIWGTTPGKWLCGLRIRSTDGTQLGFWRGMARYALFSSAMVVFEYAFTLWIPPDLLTQTLMFLGLSAIVVAWWVIRISTMRRRNGYAGVHDLVTNARVTKRPKGNSEPHPGAYAEAATEEV